MTANKTPMTDKMNALETTILEALNACDRLHVLDIAAEIDEHPVSVDRTCNYLQKQDLIRMSGGGVYTLSERGERICEG